MESKEILKEFAGKLAGLSAAAKVVAIAGAVSTYSGTGHAAENAVKAENRLITAVEPRKSDASSDAKKEESVVAKTEAVVAPKVSEATVNALLASKEKDVAKASDTKVTAVAKANVSPKNESKTAPKYDTRYYQAPGTTKPSDRTSRPARSSYRSSPSYSSSYDYNYNSAPTAPSYATSTSDNAFGETASSSRRSSGYSSSSRRPYASGSYRSSRSRSTETDETRLTSVGESLASGKKGSDAGATASSSSKSGQSALNSFQGFGFGGTQTVYKDRVVEKVVSSEEAEEALKIVQAAKEKGLNAEALAEKIKNFEQDNTQIGSDADAEKIHALEHELQVERTQNANLRQQVQQAANANAQPQGINAVIPPPPPPPPGVIAQGGNGVPLPPGVPPPPGVPGIPAAPGVPGIPAAPELPVDEHGIPLPPPLPEAPTVSVGVPQTPKGKSAMNLLDDLVHDVDKKERKERMKLRQEEMEEQRAEEDFVGTANAFFKKIDEAGSSKQTNLLINVAKTDYSRKQIGRVLRINRRKKGTYAFYEGLIRALSNFANKDFADVANLNPADEKDEKAYNLKIAKRYGCTTLLKDACPEILRAVAYFERNDKDVLLAAWKECMKAERLPEFLPDAYKYKAGDYYALCADCFKKYDVSLSYATDAVISRLARKMLDEECVSKNKGDAKFRREQFQNAVEAAVSFLEKDDPSVDKERIAKRIVGKYLEDIEEIDLNEVKNEKTFFEYADYWEMADALKVLKDKGVPDNNVAFDADNGVQGKGSALDRALLAIVKDSKAKQWYDDATIEKMLRESRNEFVLENDKKVMDPPTKRQLLDLLREFNMAFLFSCFNDKYLTGEIKRIAGQQAVLRTRLKAMLKTIQVSSLIKVEDELKQEWDKWIEHSGGKNVLFKKGKGIFKEMDDQFKSLLSDLKKDRETGLAKYEEQQTYPIISKIRKAAMTGSGELLKLAITGEEETELMLNNKRFMGKVLQTALLFSKSKRWWLKGQWVGRFLKDLPLKTAGVTYLALEDSSFNKLESLNDCSTLEILNFVKVNFYENALNGLKLRNAKLYFMDVKNTDTLYTHEGILKRLADANVEMFFKKCPWAVNGVKQPVAADPAQGGLPGLHHVGGGGNNNVAGVVPGGNPFGVNLKKGSQNNGNAVAGGFQLPALKKKGEINAGEKVILKGRGEVQDHAVDMINQIRNRMKALPEDANLGDEFFANWKAIWESDDVETIEADLPGAMFESRVNVEEFFNTAVAIANQAGKPLVLIGRFETAYRWDSENKGRVARALLKLKSPLKIASTSQYGTDVVMLNELLTTMADLKKDGMQLKSVELDRIVSAGTPAENQKLLTCLGDLGVETVIFSHLDDAAMEVRQEVTNAQGKKGYKMVLEKFNAWKDSFDFAGENSDAWKHLFKKIKVVDLRNNDDISVERLNDLKARLEEIKNERVAVAGNADEAPGAQQPEKIALQSVLLPDNADAGLATEIKNLVDELKGN